MDEESIMLVTKQAVMALATCALVVAGGCNRAPEKLTPEAAAAKGDAMIKEMSKNLSSVPAFSYTSEERREVTTGGAKTTKQLKRDVVIRRPNAAAIRGTGDSGDTAAWYDGKQLTLVSAKDKVWARGPMPPTLDEALDFLAAEYAAPLPSADLLYSSPYDALMTKDTVGGWVDVQKVGDRSCDHLVYRQAVVDWELWLNENHMPCQFKITHKTAPGAPSTVVTYSNVNTSPQISDDTFTPKVPEGYTRIRVMRHGTVQDPNAGTDAAAPAAAAPVKKTP
jgi:hypothetical protein